MKKIITLVFSVLIAGCTFGNGRICGPQTPMANCDREAYERLVHPKPYIENWQKEGADSKTRDEDSEHCGGGRGRFAPGFGPRKIEAERRPGDKENDAYGRLHENWQRCMLKKGYRYTGQCPVEPLTPACGAP